MSTYTNPGLWQVGQTKTVRGDDDLSRFTAAQDRKSAYVRALREIEQGRKRTHWMWFVFPQLRALAKSDVARYYGLADIDEARAYVSDHVLRARLGECTTHVLRHRRLMFSHPDNQKLQACMTLFSKVVEDPTLPDAVLAKFYGGMPHQLTLDVLDGKPIVLPKSASTAMGRVEWKGAVRERAAELSTPRTRQQIVAYVSQFGLDAEVTRRLINEWHADSDRSYDAGWQDRELERDWTDNHA